MAYTTKQLVTPDPGAEENAGWCLSEQQKVWHSPVANPDAWHAWLSAQFKHTDRNLPDVGVLVWFSWINKIVGDRNFGKNQGHVVSWIPGHGFLSSPGAGFGQKWFNSIAAVESYFHATFVGWTEDINGLRVAEIDFVPDQAPAPVVTGAGGGYHLVVEVAGYADSSSAENKTNSNSRVPASDYTVFNQANGVVNITSQPGQPGWWINPSDNVAAAAPAPAAPSFAVGDTVAPNAADTHDYNGTAVHAWDASYIITEIQNDRAVLSARGVIWAAMHVSDIHKV